MGLVLKLRQDQGQVNSKHLKFLAIQNALFNFLPSLYLFDFINAMGK
jgi:hypothetical protein